MQAPKIFILTLLIGIITSGTILSQSVSFTIKAANEKYSPSTITVNAGQVVKLKINSKMDNNLSSPEGYVHSWTIYDLGIDFKLKPGVQNFSFVAPEQTGTYKIECNVECGDQHEYMTGKLIVK